MQAVEPVRPGLRRAADAGGPAWLDRTRLAQPDRTTCGSSTLVLARMLSDVAYAGRVLTGHDLRTGTTDPGLPGETQAQARQRRFGAESLTMHRRTNRAFGGGRLQIPWPRALGTLPWALANVLGNAARAYRVAIVDPLAAGRSYDRITRAVDAGHAVPLYVGNRRLPRHVVLVTGRSGDGLRVFDPARGEEVVRSRAAFTAGRLGIAGWQEVWLAVLPRGP
jgi:hypothetical protein